jgi:predicted TIM-barrel fold metal-dependent hydrolase
VIITDAQVHVWNRETPGQPWPSWGRDLASRDEFTADSLLAEMDKAGIGRAVLVPPSWEGTRNETCLAAAAAHPDRFRVMGRIDVTSAQRQGRIAEWRRQPGMLGIRVSFLQEAMLGILRSGRVDWLWRECEAADLPVMIFAPLHVSLIDAVAAAHPGLRLVVDHFALREGVRDDVMDLVVDEVAKLAKYPNVTVKATGLPSYVPETYPFPSLHERIRRIFDAFGPQRIFWGSDLSRMRCSYAEVRNLFTECLDFLTEGDLEWIMGRSACQWLGWDD